MRSAFHRSKGLATEGGRPADGHHRGRCRRRRRRCRNGVPGAEQQPPGQDRDASPGARRHRPSRLPAQPAGPGPVAGPAPDPRRRRPLLHPRLGRRAAARRGRRHRGQPLRPRAVQRRVAGAPRRALRLAHPARPRRRPADRVAAPARGQPRAPGRRRRARGAARRPGRGRARSGHRRRRGRPHRHPASARSGPRAHRLHRRRPRQSLRLHV